MNTGTDFKKINELETFMFMMQ